MRNSVSLNIELTVGAWQEDDSWIAECPALGVVTQAEAEVGAYDALEEAIEAWFESCLERDVLRAALEEVGFAAVCSSDSRALRGNLARRRDGARMGLPASAWRQIQISLPALVLDVKAKSESAS